MKDEKYTVIENGHMNGGYYLMKVNAPYIAETAKPGNFVMVTPSHTHDPILKRPFGIFNAEAPYIWLYYQVVGRGTERIASLKPGDSTQILGPLGNTFPECSNKNVLMIAGGRGIAPLHFAIKHFTANNRVFLIYGAKSKTDLNLIPELSQLNLTKTFLYTDDGSSGKKGFVTTDIQNIIEENHIDVTYSCGPDAMFHSLASIIGKMEIKNYVSLEALMGCGFGICYSCAVKTTDGTYKKVCSDGPVFAMEEIQW